MMNLSVENIGDLAVVQCEGRIVQSEAAFKLRKAVTLQGDARVVVLDLSQVHAVEGGGLGMLLFLQRWAHDHNIRFKLLKSVRARLDQASSLFEFDIPTLDEMMSLLGLAESGYALAA